MRDKITQWLLFLILIQGVIFMTLVLAVAFIRVFGGR